MIDIPLRDAIYLVEAIQILPLLILVPFFMYRLVTHKAMTHTFRLIMWSLFSVSVLAAAVTYGMALYGYVHYDRPIYKLENQRFGGH